MNKFHSLYVDKINPNDEFVVLLEWLVKPEQLISKGQSIAQLESSKVAYEYESPNEGYFQPLVSPGEKVPFHKPIGKLWVEKNFSARVDASRSIEVHSEVVITAKAKRLMQKHGIEVTAFPGVFRLSEEDVLAFVQTQPSQGASAIKTVHTSFRPSTAGQLVPLSTTKEFEISSLRRARADFTFSDVTKEIPFLLVQEALKVSRNQGNHVTVGELMLWAAGKAFLKYPMVNSCRVDSGIHLYGSVHIGVAINIKRGLKTPVIRDVDKLSLSEVSSAVKDMSLKYLRNELRPHDLIGGTFTVTDLSSFGVQHFTPVVNEGQAAILGICSPNLVGTSLSLILSFNHDIIDGMLGAQFLSEIENIIKSSC